MIERRGRPWKLTRVTSMTERTVITEGGFEYDRSTGFRLDRPDFPERVVTVSPAGLDFLAVREFMEDLSRLQMHHLTPEQVQAAAPLARELRRVLAQRE